MASIPSTWPYYDNSPPIEKRGFTTMKIHKFRYTWMIKNYSLCKKETYESVESPQFSFMAENELQWNLLLYPNGDSLKAKDYVSIFLQLLSVVEAGVRVVLEFSILSKNGEKTNVYGNPGTSTNIFDSKSGKRIGYWGFISKDDLKTRRESLLPNDTLTIMCDIGVIDGIDSQPGPNFNVPQCEYSYDGGRWFGNPKFSDVKLIVGSEQFHAHKVILAAHSSVFAAMFEHEMTEQETNEVEIEDISHEIIGEMLRFIYSGKVLKLREIAKDLLMAADKYALDRLKVTCEEELHASLTVETAAEVLMIADRHSSAQLEKQAMDFIVQHATDVVKTASYKSMLKIPSLIEKVVQAIIIENSKHRLDSGTTDAKSG